MADNDQTTPPATSPAPAPAGEQAPQQPAQAQPPAPAGEQHVPYTRFKQVNDQLSSLREQLQQITGERDQATGATQSLEQRLATLESERDQARAQAQRLQVATSKRLPAELAERLRGDTPEELAADADRLLALLKPIADGPGVPPPSGGRPAGKFDPRGKTAAEIRAARAKGLI